MSKENFTNPIPTPEQPEPSEQPQKKEPEIMGISRRDFLKTAAKVVGGGALFGAFTHSAFKDYNETLEKNERENTHEGIAKVLDKKHIPVKLTAVMAGKAVGAISTPEKWQLILSVNDGLVEENEKNSKNEVDVSKEEFDSTNVGEEIPVTYQVNGEGSEKYRDKFKVKSLNK